MCSWSGWQVMEEGVEPSRDVAASWLDWGEIGAVQGVLVCGLRAGQDP